MNSIDRKAYHFLLCGIRQDDGSIKIFGKFESFDFATMAMSHYVYHDHTNEYYYIVTEQVFNQSILIGE